MKEVDLQAQIIVALHKAGGEGWKSAHSFMNGLPDLDMKFSWSPWVKPEVKFVPKMTKTGIVTAAPSPNQADFMKRIRRVGGATGLIVLVALGRPGKYAIKCLRDPPWGPRIDMTTDTLAKEIGGEWPVEEMVRRLMPDPSL